LNNLQLVDPLQNKLFVI